MATVDHFICEEWLSHIFVAFSQQHCETGTGSRFSFNHNFIVIVICSLSRQFPVVLCSNQSFLETIRLRLDPTPPAVPISAPQTNLDQATKVSLTGRSALEIPVHLIGSEAPSQAKPSQAAQEV